MIVTVEKNELIVRIPLQSPAPSASGKTLIVASSRGNVKTATMVEGKPLTVSINAYIPK
jgi:hypothetical protein